MSGILVTRPVEDAAPLADRLVQMGFKPYLAPLLTVRYRQNMQPDLSDVQAILFTSANGVRAFCAVSNARTQAVFCVGAATAEMARLKGFSMVTEAGGDVNLLAAAIGECCDPRAGRVYHAAASRLAGDLEKDLKSRGFQYRREILYETTYTETLTPPVIAAIMAGEIGGVLLFSPRSAHVFKNLYQQAALGDYASSLSIFCLSSNVAREIADMDWLQVTVADHPTQASLLARVNEKLTRSIHG